MALFSRCSAPDWTGGDDPEYEAKCRKTQTPSRGDDPWFDDMREAAAICNGDTDGRVCPMRQRCLVWSLKNCERYGVWGGMLPHDRARMRKKYRNQPEKWEWHPPTARPPESEPASASPSPLPSPTS
ncbi:WhiB family transcriptional regulator [Streptomyces sp. NPDC004528]|uniref:WhiB family transcriptional regulator n=1 Tax=Streptomyces sp. NPDC004528 TaxID=3154550 RepID=UPI0033A4B200